MSVYDVSLGSKTLGTVHEISKVNFSYENSKETKNLTLL